MRAFDRHDHVHAASCFSLPKLSEASAGRPNLSRLFACISMVSASPETMFSAASWLHQAAEQGEATGQFPGLGLLFDKGYGVPQDWVQAEVWLNLAAAHAGARQREYFARVRDAVAQKLTLDQLAETQRRASAWTPIASWGPAPLAARY